MTRRLRAGVIGASGIGKHHAKWFHLLGCELVGFAGRSDESVASTEKSLRDLFGFEGRGFVGVDALLGAGLDVVSICSPMPMHYRHMMQAVDRGVHVLCEKPLVYDPAKSASRLLAEAAEAVDAADDSDLIGAVNTQYAAAVEPIRALCARAGADATSPGYVFMQMESRGGKAGAEYEKIWIDLASHPISVVLAFAGPGELVPGSARATIEQRRCEARFRYRRVDGREIEGHVLVCNVPEGPLTRRIVVDDAVLEYEGRNDENGVFCTYMKLGAMETKAEDLMHTSVRRFVSAASGHGQPLATLADGLDNLRLQLHLMGVAEHR
jgi:predicted dehydrogenase